VIARSPLYPAQAFSTIYIKIALPPFPYPKRHVPPFPSPFDFSSLESSPDWLVFGVFSPSFPQFRLLSVLCTDLTSFLLRRACDAALSLSLSSFSRLPPCTWCLTASAIPPYALPLLKCPRRLSGSEAPISLKFPCPRIVFSPPS